MKIIDLRSDTVTQPTPEMREAMYKAEVGDDVYGEDPTVNRLQEMAAQRMSKEAALFVSSGTMGNLIAVLAQCQRGDEVIMGDLGHTFLFEAGGVSALGGIFPHTLPNLTDGTMALETLRDAIQPDDVHHSITRMIILENTHNRCGGVILPQEYCASVGALAREHSIRVHLDGARIFNAAVALSVSPKELAAFADTVTFCLSKGLAAPVGSVLCGDRAFIERARRLRKMLGGGTRQAGVLAAAGIVALEQMVDRLADDHRRARELANGLSEIPEIGFDMGLPQTNMVFASLKPGVALDAGGFTNALAQKGIRVGNVADRRVRMVTHYGIEDEDIRETITVIKEVLTQAS